MKCELFNGVTYYTDGDACTDIDVAPDIKSVALMHPIVNIARNTCKKEYPNVEELIITMARKTAANLNTHHLDLRI